MKNRSLFDAIFLLLFALTLGSYGMGFPCMLIAEYYQPWGFYFQVFYLYFLRPLFYFFSGYAGRLAAADLLSPVPSP